MRTRHDLQSGKLRPVHPGHRGKVGDFEVSSGLYLLAQFSAYQQAAQLAGKDQDTTDVKAFLKATITTDADSGETAVVQDYVADKTLETCAPLPPSTLALPSWAGS